MLAGLLLTGCALKFTDRPVDQPDTSTDTSTDMDTATDPDVPPDTPTDTDLDTVIEDVPDADADALDAPDTGDLVDVEDVPDTVEEDVTVDDVPVDTFVNPYEPVDLVFWDLQDMVSLLADSAICTDSGTIPLPDTTRRNYWTALLGALLNPGGGTVDWGNIYARGVTYSLSIFVLRDPTYGDFVVIADPNRCEGIYVVNLDAEVELVVQVPYPVSDTGTLDLGTSIFREMKLTTGSTIWGARALMIAGADRCYDARTTICNGQTVACAGSLQNANYSDAALNPALIFQHVHSYLFDWSADTVALQIQDQTDASGAHIITTDGTTISDTGSLSFLLRDALQSKFPAYSSQIVSCNFDSGFTSTCGTTNVQGRLTNGSTNTCATAATVSANRFMLMELSALMRDSSRFDKITEAVQIVIDTF